MPAGSRALGGHGVGSPGLLACPPNSCANSVLLPLCAQPIPWDLWEVSLLARRWSRAAPPRGAPHVCTHSRAPVRWPQLRLQLLLLSGGSCPGQPQWERAPWFHLRRVLPAWPGVRAVSGLHPTSGASRRDMLPLGWAGLPVGRPGVGSLPLTGFLSTGATRAASGLRGQVGGRGRRLPCTWYHNLAALAGGSEGRDRPWKGLATVPRPRLGQLGQPHRRADLGGPF